MPKAKEIRAKAREAMAGKWGRFVGMNCLYLLTLVLIGCITMVPVLGSLGGILDISVKAMQGKNVSETALLNAFGAMAASGGISGLLSLVAFLIEVPLAYALTENVMKAKRDNETTATYFFGRIFPNFARAWKVTLWTLVKMIIPYLLFILGMVVIGLVSALFSGLGDFGVILGGIIIFAGYIALCIWFIGKVLNLSLGEYIAIDNPELTAKESVEKSIELMPGYRWKLICLSLSFIGWIILSGITLGIGNLFLTPYMSVASVVFYEEVVKAHGEKDPAQTTPVTGPIAEPVVEQPVVEETPVVEQPTQE